MTQSDHNSYPLGALAGGAAAAAAALSFYIYHRSSNKSALQSGPDRPQLVLDSIKDDKTIFYFGVGSNLSRKKLENRSICGTKIHIISREPGVIPDYRLAFNLRALPPLEPAMGGLELLPSACVEQNGGVGNDRAIHRKESLPLKAYEKQECHGALIQLSAQDYNRVYTSEGGGSGATEGYEEIIVTCVPYDTSHPPVQAVAYRARDHARLAQDYCPSKRYMEIIRKGALELGLKPCYQEWLAAHPVQETSKPLRKIAINSLVFTTSLSM